MAENNDPKFTNFSPAIKVADPKLAADFYVAYFSGRLKFDCGWYIVVEVDGQDICFMKPQNSEELYQNGLTFNFEVSDVDAEYERLRSLGVNIKGEPENHEWGDRSFFLFDNVNIGIYIYTPCEIGEKFKDAIIS